MADEKRIERARDWYEKQDGMTPTPEFMADFAESELARTGDYVHDPQTCGCGSDWEYCPYLKTPPIPNNPDARAIAERIVYAMNVFPNEAAVVRMTELLSAELPRWIPIKTVEDLPKADGDYWFTRRGNGEVVSRKFATNREAPSYLVEFYSAYMPYIEPEPYNPEASK